MKFLFDFFPLIVFFAGYAFVDIFFATGAAMAATVLQVAWSWLKHRKVERLMWINFGAIMFFGGLTLLLQDERFIKVKPTIVYWIIAGALLVSHYFFSKNPIKLMMEPHFDAPERVWTRWLINWVMYFGVLGVVNLLVAHGFSTDVWVKFKVFGTLALTVVLAFVQTFMLMRYARHGEGK
ncbi:MAG: septation protein A [Betaproteobacteria bacterium]|nr:septation protein A [Betaproteobacteria bacterium]